MTALAAGSAAAAVAVIGVCGGAGRLAVRAARILARPRLRPEPEDR